LKRNGAPFLWNGCAVLAEFADHAILNYIHRGLNCFRRILIFHIMIIGLGV
jgi:hypothetical protein